MIPTSPVEIAGAWFRGWALDEHTTSSEFVGYDEQGNPQFDTVRSVLGELVFQLKYRGARTADRVAEAMQGFFDDKQALLDRIDLIVPVPPSTVRTSQPVAEVARLLGNRVGKPFASDAVRKTRATPELKGILDPEKRRELLDGAFGADRDQVDKKVILLIDDLFRSGATANEVTLALRDAGALRVYFLAATRTRRKS